MEKIYIKFKNVPELTVTLGQSSIVQRWATMMKEQYIQGPMPDLTYLDGHSIETFDQIVNELQSIVGWDWHRPEYTQQTINELHKDLEVYLANGFENVPSTWDSILDRAHKHLHIKELLMKGGRPWIGFRWNNSNGFYVNEDEYEAQITPDFGGVYIHYSHVGRSPWVAWQTKDSSNLALTCKFNDFVRPGFDICTTGTSGHSISNDAFDFDPYIAWFEQHAPEWLEHHGVNKLIKFTGFQKFGNIENINDFQMSLLENNLTLEHIRF